MSPKILSHGETHEEEYLFSVGSDSDILLKYNLLRIELRNDSVGGIALLYSPDFDTNDEPILAEFISVRDEEIHMKRYTGKYPVYHHKILFVKNSYRGFDICDAWRRSAYVSHFLTTNHIASNKIGWKHQWEQLLIQYG